MADEEIKPGVKNMFLPSMSKDPPWEKPKWSMTWADTVVILFDYSYVNCYNIEVILKYYK